MGSFKLVLLLESLPPEFDQRKAYILANQNITLKGAATSLASNEVEILRDHATGLEIEANFNDSKDETRTAKIIYRRQG